MNQLLKKFSFLRKNNTYDLALKLYQEGNFREAIKEFSKIISHPEKKSGYYNLSLFYLKESYLELGYALEHLGRYEEAAANFSSAAQISNYPDIYYHLGLCFCFLEEFEKAKQALHQSLEINPNYTCSLFLLGFIYVKLRIFNKAEKCFSQSIKLAPNFADYHYLFGSLKGLQGQLSEARKAFQKSLEINPQFKEAGVKIAFLEKIQKDEKSSNYLDQEIVNEFFKDFVTVPVTNMGISAKTEQISNEQNILEDIILFYEKAVQINPQYADLHHHLGVYCTKRGDYKKAKKAFLGALRINPHYTQALINLALLYQKEGDIDQSLKTLNEAVFQHPNYPDLHYHLGILYNEKKDFGNACKEFQKALSINPQYSECHLGLAILYETQKQADQAIKYWRLYFKNCPNLEWEKEIKAYLKKRFPSQSSYFD